MPGWLVLWYMRQYGPVLSAFNQGRKQNLWDCTGIAGIEFTFSNLLEMQLTNLGHLYLQLCFMRHSVFYGMFQAFIPGYKAALQIRLDHLVSPTLMQQDDSRV